MSRAMTIHSNPYCLRQPLPYLPLSTRSSGRCTPILAGPVCQMGTCHVINSSSLLKHTLVMTGCNYCNATVGGGYLGRNCQSCPVQRRSTEWGFRSMYVSVL